MAAAVETDRMTPVASYRVLAACAMLDRMPPGERVALEPLTWEEYDAIVDYRDDSRRGIKVTFSDGRLEIMTKSLNHERFLRAMEDFVAVLCECFDLDELDCRETTIQRADLERGIEPDGWYYFGATARKLYGRDRLSFPADPPPDLAIEVEVTESLADRLDIYRAYGIREVWRFNGTTFRIQALREGGYSDSSTSLFFPPLPFSTIVPLLGERSTMAPREWRSRVRNWVCETYPQLHNR
jgi:Uma2 family endonuclease